MKKTICFVMLAVIMSVSALFVHAKVGSIDSECQAHGFGVGIAKWEWTGSSYALEDSKPGYTTGVTGDNDEAYWTADPAVDGVLSKEGLDYQVLPGGTSGTVTAGDHQISHITFCGIGEPIPEFSAVSAGLAVAGTGVAFWFLRRRWQHNP
ncbi:hypothetical protein COT48_03635 [Candidatus Woesearchaeota archaeon CG08_land_8_20_14_0_20_47_9]|nr:MAG: hypothetical protein AUJ69_03820 [Candidatus Woesearchaeota archaeon CG1_02_47_18]PIO03751.1 MAG: hypothetical protein COT48_03635 [Candidatus Woesearchaeota archaeon CG08_land_8_20_14_0_20_47_9]